MKSYKHKIRIKHRKQIFILFVLVGLLGIAGCARNSIRSAISLATKNGFRQITIKANGFNINGMLKSQGTGKLLSVYIEGDGFAWKNKYTISNDSTPKESVSLSLATRDPGTKIFYIARPCQYSDTNNPKCNPSYWTSHRYSSEVVNAMSDAIDEAKFLTGTGQIRLTGFSGGGTMAILLASIRNDVIYIITIAANLDHKKWTEFHGVTPLFGSLNAADYAQTVQSIPQIHYVGGRDSNVTEPIVRAYYNRMSNALNTKVVVLEEYSHSCCWSDVWTTLLNMKTK